MMNIIGINSLINNSYTYSRKDCRAKSAPAAYDVFIKNSNPYVQSSISRVSPSFGSISDRTAYKAGASVIVALLFNNRLADSIALPSGSGRTFTELIKETVEELKRQCPNLDNYRSNLVKLLDILNNTARDGSDVYEPTQIVANAINNSYYEYGRGGNPSASPAEMPQPAQNAALTTEQRNQIRDIVSEFMRLKDSFRIWNFVRKESEVKRVLSNFIPELRNQCTSLEQYKQMTSIFADNVYSLYRAVQDNDNDGSFYELALYANSARDNAETYYNSARGVTGDRANEVAPAEATATAAPQASQGSSRQSLKSKLSMSDVEEVNTYLIDIAKKYANGASQPERRGPALTFEPPASNKSMEDYYSDKSGDVTSVWGDVVLRMRNESYGDKLDSALLKLMDKRGFDPNHKFDDGYNVGCRPIFILTTLNKPYLLQEILKLRKADPNLTCGIYGHQTALSRAVENNILDCAYVLLKSGKMNESEIERCKRECSMTSEMRGLLDSYPNMDEYINSTCKSLEALEKINIKTLDDVMRTPNIDVNFIDSNGNNILHAACAIKDKEEAMRLASNALGNNVNINCVNKKGEAPIKIAIKNKNYDLAAFLINKGADLSVFKDELDNSFAHIIISMVEEEEAIKLLDIAKEKGVSLDMQNCGGVTPFMQAVKLRKYKLIQYLLTSGVMANKTDNFGRTPLHFACLLNDPKSLEILLNNFVNTRIRDNTGKLAAEYLKKPELINFYRMFDNMF